MSRSNNARSQPAGCSTADDDDRLYCLNHDGRFWGNAAVAVLPTLSQKKKGAAKSKPAAPIFRQISRLHSEVEAHRVSGTVVDHVQHLFREAAMRAVGRIVDVLPLDEHIQ